MSRRRRLGRLMARRAGTRVFTAPRDHASPRCSVFRIPRRGEQNVNATGRFACQVHWRATAKLPTSPLVLIAWLSLVELPLAPLIRRGEATKLTACSDHAQMC